MFELVRANKRRSMVLAMVMLIILMALGFLIGSAVVPSIAATEFEGESVQPGLAFDPTPGFIGMGIAFCIWMAQALIAYYQGGRILLAVSRARPIEKADHPQLYNVVEEMTIAARLPKMPQVYIIDDMSLNAFATGRDPNNAAVAVTAGLLGKLDRDELQGVIAHEITHIVNRDVLFMTMIGIMLGTIVLLSEVFLRSMFYSAAGSSRRFRGSRGGGKAQAVIMVAAIVLAILAPLIAQLIYFAVSRRREYLADAGAAVYTRYPEGLASALEAISGDTTPPQSANRVTAPMYINNPTGQGMALNLTSTHPPIQERVRILRGIAGGVSYRTYQAAWAKASGRGAAKMPDSALHEEGAPMREAHPEAAQQKKGSRERMREAGDVLRKVNQFLFLTCACGMRMKLPPEFKKEQVECPRCHRHIQAPMAQIAAAAAVGDSMAQQAGGQGEIPVAEARGGPLPPLEVTREGKGWMSFKCSCGAVKNLAPSFVGKQTTCAQCGRQILIKQTG